MSKSFRPHILIFEPRIEGHHLSWLRYITEDLLAAGFRLTLAVDLRPEAKKLIQNNLSILISKDPGPNGQDLYKEYKWLPYP